MIIGALATRTQGKNLANRCARPRPGKVWLVKESVQDSGHWYFTTKGKYTTKSFHESGPYRTDFWKSELQKSKSQKEVISARRVPPWGRGSSGGPRKIGHFEPQNPPKKEKSFIEMMAAREGESPLDLDPDAHPKG